MDEILALQQELARVQSAPSAFRLSEPNVVEVVQKMVELGLLDVRRVHRAVLEPRDAQQQQGEPLLLGGGPGRRHQLRLRAVRRVGGVVQRLS